MRDAVANNVAAHRQEAAANHDIGGERLNRDGQDRVAMVALWIQSRIRGDGIHVVIMVHQAGILVVGRVHEARVHAAVAEQPGDAPAAGQVELDKVAAHQDAAVRLQHDAIDRVGLGADRIISAGAGIERRIHRPVRSQTNQAVIARQTIEGK